MEPTSALVVILAFIGAVRVLRLAHLAYKAATTAIRRALGAVVTAVSKPATVPITQVDLDAAIERALGRVKRSERKEASAN